ncbi:SH3 domain-containing YSC84-like protein 1, partial [Rhizoclosmatium hyalinum]
ISLEGSVIIERKETNAAFYRRQVSAKEILSGSVPPPPAAEQLYRALNRRTEQEVGSSFESSNGGFQNPFAKRSDTVSSNGASAYRTPTTSNISSPMNPRAIPALPGRLPAPAPPSGPRVRALYDFDGQRDGDLSFRAGDEIIVVQEAANDWWTGRIGAKEGVFPANYVQRL